MFKNLMARFTSRVSTALDLPPEPKGNALPSPGEVYAFQTAPYDEFAAAETNRYAAFKIMGANETLLAVGVLDRIWDRWPTLTEVSGASLLREHRFAHTGQTAAFGLQIAWWLPSNLMSVRPLGKAALSSEERKIFSDIVGHVPGTSHSTLHAVNYAAEGEWRWANDRKSFVDEYEKKKAKVAAIHAAQEERYRTRLSKLTWDQLLAETPFERWVTSPPFPPANFTDAARRTIHGACRDLSVLGPKPKKAEVRAVLKACVEWFNKADAEAGGVIETEEREDICAALEEIVFVARQKGLVEEIDNWREW
jgi:hypothetical protein